MSEPVYSRAPDVVWRLGPDRVLVRRVADAGQEAAADLIGAAALVWIALDEPGDAEAIYHRIAGRRPDLGGIAELLVSHSWIVSTSG